MSIDKETRLRLNQLAYRSDNTYEGLKHDALMEYLWNHEEDAYHVMDMECISYAELLKRYPAVYRIKDCKTDLADITLWYARECLVCDNTGKVAGSVYHIGKYAYILNSDTLGTEIPEDRQASFEAELRKVTSIPALERLVDRMDRELKPDKK